MSAHASVQAYAEKEYKRRFALLACGIRNTMAVSDYRANLEENKTSQQPKTKNTIQTRRNNSGKVERDNQERNKQIEPGFSLVALASCHFFWFGLVCFGLEPKWSITRIFLCEILF